MFRPLCGLPYARLALLASLKGAVFLLGGYSVKEVIFRSLRSLPHAHSASPRSLKGAVFLLGGYSVKEVMFRSLWSLPLAFGGLSLARLPCMNVPQPLRLRRSTVASGFALRSRRRRRGFVILLYFFLLVGTFSFGAFFFGHLLNLVFFFWRF